MTINISTIADSEGKLPVSDTLTFGTVEFDGGTYEFDRVELTGQIVNIGGSLTLEATASGQYKTSCARCLKPIMISFDADIYEDLNGEDANTELVKIERGECTLDDLVQTAVLSQMPMVALCREDCKGLCPMCGKDLNEEACLCEQDDRDPRFDILKNFKADL